MARTKSNKKLTPTRSCKQDAEAQVKAIVAAGDVPRFKAINGKQVEEFECEFPKAWPRLQKLSEAGYNCYLFAQDMPFTNVSSAKDEDIENVRVIFADGDDAELPKEVPNGVNPVTASGKLGRGYWHCTPTFTLVHPDTGRWWAFWNVSGCPPERFKETQLRIAQLYGSDPTVNNLSRIVRLAGLPRWKKGEKFAPYKFVAGAGVVSKFHLHDSDLPEVVAGKDRKRADDPKHINVRENKKHNIEAYMNWAAKDARVTVEGGQGPDDPGRNVLLAATAAMGHSYALSWEVVHDILWDVYNPRLTPQLEEEEFEITVESGHRSATSAQGNMTSDYRKLRTEELAKLFEDSDLKDGGEDNPVVMGTFGDVLAADPQPVVEIIPGRIEKGVVNFLSGAGGVHKSRLSIQYGVCVQAQAPVFGRATMPGITFVYVSAEDPFDEIVRRTHKIVDRLGLPRDVVSKAVIIDRYDAGDNSLVTMNDGSGYELTPFYHYLADRIANIPGHKFVVLDSVYDFVRFAGKAKVNEDAVRTFIRDVLGDFCHATNSTFLVIAHPSQAGIERGDGTGWSVAWTNAPRVRDVLSEVRDTDSFELKAVKRSHGVKPKPIILRYLGAMLPMSEFDQSVQKAELYIVVVEVAIQCAERKNPIRKQSRISSVVLDLIQERTGIELGNKEVKDILESALMKGDLDYLDGSSRRAAGYYPPDRAEQLARDTKKDMRETRRSTIH